MTKEISVLFAEISTYISLIPSLLAFFRIKSPNRTHRLLAILVWGGTLVSQLADLIVLIFDRSNLFLLHFYTIFDFILLSLIFRPVLHSKLARTLIIIFPLFAAANSIFFERLITFNVLNRSISAFVLMFYALSYFAHTLREMKILRLEKDPMFWLSIGVLFYNAGSFFIFLFSKDIAPPADLWIIYFGIHSIFTILLYGFYTIALWVQPQT